MENEYEYKVEGIYYCSESTVNLISVTKFEKQLKLSNKEFPESTSMHTFTNNSIFTWDHGKYKCTIIYPLSSLLTIYIY